MPWNMIAHCYYGQPIPLTLLKVRVWIPSNGPHTMNDKFDYASLRSLLFVFSFSMALHVVSYPLVC